MSVRAKFRSPSRKNATPLGWRIWGGVALFIVGVFIVGYAATAFSFSQSIGTEVATVPDVRELTVQAASRAIGRSSLEIVVADSFPNVGTPAGSVLAQSPLPGQEVSPGSVVEVFLSTGAPRPVVPNVDGMSLSLATRSLQTAGFDILVEEDTGSVPAGRVKLTDPPPGTLHALPATVRLVMSTGPAAVEMPRLLGLDQGSARSLLEDLGLLVTETRYSERYRGEEGSVIDQDPMPGDSVKPGSSIRLVVIGRDPIGDAYRDRQFDEDQFDRQDSDFEPEVDRQDEEDDRDRDVGRIRRERERFQ